MPLIYGRIIVMNDFLESSFQFVEMCEHFVVSRNTWTKLNGNDDDVNETVHSCSLPPPPLFSPFYTYSLSSIRRLPVTLVNRLLTFLFKQKIINSSSSRMGHR